MKKLILFMMIALSSILVAQEGSYQKTLKEFLEVSGSNEAQSMMLKQMFGQFKKMQPNNAMLSDMEALIEKEINTLNQQLLPVYQKHLSEDDLKALIKFYQSPMGQKLTSKQPLIMQEAMQIGAKWGQDVAQRIMQAK